MFWFASVLYCSLIGPVLIARLKKNLNKVEKIQRTAMGMVESLEHLI